MGSKVTRGSAGLAASQPGRRRGRGAAALFLSQEECSAGRKGNKREGKKKGLCPVPSVRRELSERKKGLRWNKDE